MFIQVKKPVCQNAHVEMQRPHPFGVVGSHLCVVARLPGRPVWRLCWWVRRWPVEPAAWEAALTRSAPPAQPAHWSSHFSATRPFPLPNFAHLAPVMRKEAMFFSLNEVQSYVAKKAQQCQKNQRNKFFCLRPISISTTGTCVGKKNCCSKHQSRVMWDLCSVQ